MIYMKVAIEDFTAVHNLITSEIVRTVSHALEAKRADMLGIQKQMEARMEYFVAVRERLEKAANIFPFTTSVEE